MLSGLSNTMHNRTEGTEENNDFITHYGHGMSNPSRFRYDVMQDASLDNCLIGIGQSGIDKRRPLRLCWTLHSRESHANKMSIWEPKYEVFKPGLFPEFDIMRARGT